MADRSGRRGGPGSGRGDRGRFGDRGGRFGDRGRGRGGGRGGGRGDFRLTDLNQARNSVNQMADRFFLKEAPRISENVEAPEAPKYHRKPDGTCAAVGTGVTVGVNYFQVRCDLKKAYQYNVSVNCDYAEQLERSIIDKLASDEQWGEGWVFDGRRALFTTDQFMQPEERVVEVTLEQGNRSRQFNVTISMTNEVQMDAIENFMRGAQSDYPADAVRVLDVLLSHAVSLIPDRVLHRKNIFMNDPTKIHEIGHAAQAWLGYHQSLRPCQNGLYLNMDTACGAFYKPIVVTEFIAELLQLHPQHGRGGGGGQLPPSLTPQQISRASRTLRNLTICLRRGGGKKKIAGITHKPAECMFEHRQRGEISVLDYYEGMNEHINHPGWPCLDCSKGKRVCYVPCEFATLAPAQFVKHLTERNQEQMIRVAAKAPRDKEQELVHLIQNEARIDSLPRVGQFQLSGAPSTELTQINARVLPAPHIVYRGEDGKGDRCFYVGTDGQWNLADMPISFYKGKKLKSWALVSILAERDIKVPGECGIDAFLAELCRILRNLNVIPPNVDLSRPPVVYSSEHSMLRDIQTAKQRANEAYQRDPDIILCLFQHRNTSLYRKLKRTSDTMEGIPTQCFAGDKAGVGGNRPPRGRPQYCTNLALKINVKVGGSNSALLSSPECRLPMVHQGRPYIVFGCDVSHPSPGSNLPSIAAVVGSVDPMATRYCSRVSQQESREEQILAMKESVKGLLLDFYEHNRQKRPESIIVFRDGVSEGFFEKVLLHEYKSIREACLEMGDPGAEYSPPITYIMVQKRHHTRLFPRQAESRHRSGNVKPGTVVDSVISSPVRHDFFLCSQAGIQGTVRPAHYHVLVDENNYGADAVQMMCYWMCYMQCRCTKSISVPAPANYAHLAAMRARVIAGDETDDETSSIGSGGGGSSSHLRGGQSFVASQNKMYYV